MTDPGHFWRLIAENARDLVLLLDPEGTILWASPSNAAVLGHDPAAMLGRRVSEFIHPDDRETQREVFRRRIETGVVERVEMRALKSSGEGLRIESLGVPIRNGEGKVHAVVVAGRDITERKALEEEIHRREERLRMLLEQAPAVLWTTDRDLRVTSAVGGALPKLKVVPQLIRGVSLLDVITPDEPADEIISAHRAALAGETANYRTTWWGAKYQAHVEPLRDHEGNVAGVTGVALDITKQLAAEEKLRRSEERYRLIFESSVAGVYRSTLEGQLLECNRALATMLGFDSVDELLKIPTWELYFDRRDREVQIEELVAETTRQNAEICLRKKDGTPLWAIQNDAMVYDEETQTESMAGTLIDITARKRAEELMEHQAYHDQLTDLPNRRLFNDRLALALAHARRQNDRLAVMFLDLDHFKLINDTMAHSAGDALLKSVAARLQSTLRAEDTVSRMGGDEFTILLPQVRDENDAARVAQVLLKQFAEPFFIQEREVFVTASIGISIFPVDGEEAETLIKHADAAMYRAKDAGRDTFQFYTPLAQSRAEARLSMETALRHALERNELYLEYQPQVSLVSGRVVGVEALLRWHHPEKGNVPPREFIGVAEEIGLILPIGEWVISTALAQLTEWKRKGLTGLRMAVNISARQFQSPALTSVVSQIVSKSGVEASCLDFEITESLAMRDTELTINVLRKLKDLGISTSIDDFGTGYSSLSYLKQLPLDRLKIDQLFVREIDSNPMDLTIADAIIKMAHSMRLAVVAEGVEQPGQRAVLERLECDEMQGYLFSRAVPEHELPALLA